MSLQTRLSDLITAIGADYKSLSASIGTKQNKILITAKAATALPNSYPTGQTSIFSVASDTSWPESFGSVETTYYGDQRTVQIFWPKRFVGKYYVRTETASNVWDPWVTDDTSDSGWTNMTPAAIPAGSTGPFSAGSPNTPWCRYRRVANRITVQVQRTATVAFDNPTNPNYVNTFLVYPGTIPAAVQPPSSGPNIEIRGRFDDVPITGVVGINGSVNAGGIIITGGGLRSYAVGDICMAQAEYYLD